MYCIVYVLVYYPSLRILEYSAGAAYHHLQNSVSAKFYELLYSLEEHVVRHGTNNTKNDVFKFTILQQHKLLALHQRRGSGRRDISASQLRVADYHIDMQQRVKGEGTS